MKVISSSAVVVLLLAIVYTSASPMFGTGGMMKRKFPGASDMSYRTYREIANSNARGDSAPSAPGAGQPAPSGVAARTGGSGSDDSSWMFSNGLASPSFADPASQPGALSFNQPQPSFNQPQPSFNQPQPSFNQPQPSFNQPQPSFNQQAAPFVPQGLDSNDPFLPRYPVEWDPRDSYALLQFPYHAPSFVPQRKIFKNYY